MILLNNIYKSYKNNKTLKNVCLQIDANDRIGIVGKPGSGKTTLLRIIAGFEVIRKGEVIIDDEVVSCHNYILAPYKRKIGYVFPSLKLWPHMTVSQNIQFGLNKKNKGEARGIMQQLMEELEISQFKDMYPNQLSAGVAQCVAIARALAPRPQILLLDEPLANLDEILKIKIRNMIRKITAKYCSTLIYAAQDELEIEDICNRKVEIKEGQIMIKEKLIV